MIGSKNTSLEQFSLKRYVKGSTYKLVHRVRSNEWDYPIETTIKLSSINMKHLIINNNRIYIVIDNIMITTLLKILIEKISGKDNIKLDNRIWINSKTFDKVLCYTNKPCCYADNDYNSISFIRDIKKTSTSINIKMTINSKDLIAYKLRLDEIEFNK
jgi:hypothetical protein